MIDENLQNKIKQFKSEILPLCVGAETSKDPVRWSSDNPLAGHCAIVSLFLHNQIGADIVRCTPVLPGGKEDSHYLNKVGDTVLDLTGEQYGFHEMGGDTVFFRNFQSRGPEYLLANEDTKRRYEAFEQKAVNTMQAKKFSFAA